MYANVDGVWVPISGGAGGGMEWPIRTANVPLIIPSSASIPPVTEGFIQLDKQGLEDSDAGSYRELQFRPLSMYGPMWYGSVLHDANPSQTFTSFWLNRWGDLWLYLTDLQLFYGGTSYDSVLTPPAGTVLNDTNHADYLRDWHETYNRITYSQNYIEAQPEHWITYHYDLPPESSSAGELSSGGSDAWHLVYDNYFEYGAEGVSDWPDYEAQGGFWFLAPVLHSPYAANPSRFAVWNELVTSTSDTGFGNGVDPWSYEEFTWSVDHSMTVAHDGYPRGMVGGERRRGTFPILQAVAEVQGAATDPTWKQWYTQIGEQDVAFTAGVGGITTSEKMGDGPRHVQATVVGTTVGGPMIAQVNSPDTTHIDFYLSTAHTGTVKVSWSAQFPEPAWSATQPLVGNICVGVGQWGTLPGQYDAGYEYVEVNYDTVLIPWKSPGMTIRLQVSALNLASGVKVYDSTGTERGTVSSVNLSNRSFLWDVQSDWYGTQEVEMFHCRLPSGERSNTWRMRWGIAPVPPPLPVMTADEEQALMVQVAARVGERGTVEERRQRRRQRRIGRRTAPRARPERDPTVRDRPPHRR